jgi:uncharacterized protein YchJ
MRPPFKVPTTMAKPGRNERCPCGSGKKYKQCCLPKDEADERAVLAEAMCMPPSAWPRRTPI